MTATVGRVEVVRVGEEHLVALTEFYRRVWDHTTSIEKVRADRASAAAHNLVSPGEPPPTWLVLQDGQAIAHVTTIPLRLSFFGMEHAAHWIKGLWVLPEFQRGAAGFLVLKSAVAALGHSLSLLHEPAAIRLLQALGFKDLGLLPNRIRLLRTRTLLRRVDPKAVGVRGWMTSALQAARLCAPIVAPLADTALTLWAAARTGPLGNIRIQISDRLPVADVDQLWSAHGPGLGIGAVRSGAVLATRYTSEEYRFVLARAGDRLEGLCVVRRPRADGDARLRGAKVSTLSDLLYSPRNLRVGLALLRGAERAAREMGADALLCSATAGAVEPLLRRRAYVALPGNLHVLARLVGDEKERPVDLRGWWVTRGDSEADGTF